MWAAATKKLSFTQLQTLDKPAAAFFTGWTRGDLSQKDFGLFSTSVHGFVCVLIGVNGIYIFANYTHSLFSHL